MNYFNSSADELKAIRKLMEESTRFLSLSGLSGIFAGTFAIAGALFAWIFILDSRDILYDEYFRSMTGSEISAIRVQLMADALVVLFLSIVSSIWFSFRKASRSGMKILTPVSKRLLVNMSIPLVAGGLFILVLLFNNNIQLIIPGMLIFYGLALVNAGKFTFDEVFYLGILQIITGLVSTQFPGYGILFWVLGFGLLHIVYGLFMYRKYEA